MYYSHQISSTDLNRDNKDNNINKKIDITIPMCRSNHRLVLDKNRQDASCDFCSTKGCDFYSCIACDYDLCPSCVKKIFLDVKDKITLKNLNPITNNENVSVKEQPLNINNLSLKDIESLDFNTLLCKANHVMKIYINKNVLQNEICDNCKLKDRTYYTCITCNFSYCLTCSDILIKFINFNRNQNNQNKQNKKLIKIPFCTKNNNTNTTHWLRFSDNRPQANCDGCFKTGFKYNLTCVECDFDLCQECTIANFTHEFNINNKNINNNINSNPNNTQTNVPVCRFNHKMQLNNTRVDKFCLNCKLNLLNLNRYSCVECNTDYCVVCIQNMFSCNVPKEDLLKTQILFCKSHHKMINTDLGMTLVPCDSCTMRIAVINYCPICKVNLCYSCYNKDNNNSIYEISKNTNNTNVNANTEFICPQNVSHSLVKVQNRFFEACKVCSKKGLGESYNCKACNYDICKDCITKIPLKTKVFIKMLNLLLIIFN